MSLLEKESMALSPQLGTLRILPLHTGLGALTQRVYESDPESSTVKDKDTTAGDGSSSGSGAASLGVRRKVIVTDALSETSFSLPAIRYVIDTGLQLKTVRYIHPVLLQKHEPISVKMDLSTFLLPPPPQVYNPQIRANSQVLRTISKHQADIRAQRVNSHLPGRSKVLFNVLVYHLDLCLIGSSSFPGNRKITCPCTVQPSARLRVRFKT